MSEILLILFVILLLSSFIYSLRFPPLLIALAIATYGLKQIFLVSIPLLQIYDTLFNYILGGIIIFVFLYKIMTLTIVGCHTRDGKKAIIFLWIFLSFFWISLLWSPYIGNDTSRYIPYFIIYFIMLPYLMGSPKDMIQAFRILFIILLVGGMGLLLSPYLDTSSNMGRMVVKFQSGSHDEGNPLALSDVGIFLLLTSIMILFDLNIHKNIKQLLKWILSVLALLGIGLGFWIASISSRGEIFAGIVSGCLLVILLIIKKTKWKILIISSLSLVALIVVLFIVGLTTDEYAKWSPRFSQGALTDASDTRQKLVADAIGFSLSSPKNLLVGIGARGCEERLGMYPHNNLAQAFSETGIIGFSLLCSCYLLAFKFGFNTLSLAKKQVNKEAVLFVAFVLSLLFYDLIVEGKKGSLTFVDTYMWLALAIYSFDRARTALIDDFKKNYNKIIEI